MTGREKKERYTEKGRGREMALRRDYMAGFGRGLYDASEGFTNLYVTQGERERETERETICFFRFGVLWLICCLSHWVSNVREAVMTPSSTRVLRLCIYKQRQGTNRLGWVALAELREAGAYNTTEQREREGGQMGLTLMSPFWTKWHCQCVRVEKKKKKTASGVLISKLLKTRQCDSN